MPADHETVAAELRPVIKPVDLGEPKSIHVVGIAGAGMRAIARVLLAMGHRVSGSDRSGPEQLAELRSLGASVFGTHDASHVGDADLVTHSTAVPRDNPELVAARDRGIPVLARADLLAAISAAKRSVLVAGTHGKTTTSSMLAVLLDHAGLAPSFVIGADVARFGTGARWDTGEWVVIEADESDGTFLALEGSHAVVTSLDPDHLEFFGDEERLTDAFVAFVAARDGGVVVCADDPDTRPLRDLPGVTTYGTAASADLRLTSIEVGRHHTNFTAVLDGHELGRVSVAIAGEHNALNAAGALALALRIGVDFDVAAEGLAEFAGVHRRFEHRGEARGVTFVDDYAHLPAEVEAALSAARAGGWDRVVCVYQPHRYSRTEALGDSFGSSFDAADHVVLTDVYPAGEAPRAGVDGTIVRDSVVAASPHLSVSWRPTLDDVVEHLTRTLRSGDLCLTVGAGDLTTIPARVRDRLAARDWVDAVAAELTATRILRNEPVGERSTYRVGGPARVLAEVGSVDDLVKLVSAAAVAGESFLFVGRGSNLLVADAGFDGIAIVLGDSFAAVEVDGTSVVAGAAAALPVIARKTVSAGLRGFEWAVGVPGSMGGAVAMNAGGHGSDIAATLVEATVLDCRSGTIERRPAAELRLGYRSSAIDDHSCVIDATLRLDPGDEASGQELISEIVTWRRENQPGGQNAGSVFTNPEGDSAGRLIDEAGAKGLRIGSAAVSDKHANFIQVDPTGKADDVYDLMVAVARRVHERFGIVLEPETRLIGFPPFSIEDDSPGGRQP